MAVGSKASIAGLEGPATQVIDAGGDTVLPGFIESAHASVLRRGRARSSAALRRHGFDALAEAVRAYAADAARGQGAAAQGADYTILRRASASPAIISTASFPTGPSPCPRPIITRCGPTPRRWRWPGCCNGRTLGPGNEIVMGADGLAEGELREGEAFGPLLELAGESRVRLGLATGGEPDP